MTVLQSQIDRLAVARRSYERAEVELRAPLEELYRLVCSELVQFPAPERITADLVREWCDEVHRKARERCARDLEWRVERAHKALDESLK